jgi:drug/metabolite transporter (DMT)-like permease
MKAALSIAFLGSIIYSYFDLMAAQASGKKVKGLDVTFEEALVGYSWQVANTLFFVFGQLYEKWAMTKSKDQTSLGISTIKNTISLPVFVIIGAAKIYFSETEFNGFSSIDLSGITATTWFVIFLTGIGCFAISICYMTLYKISEATTITVGGNFNKIVSIFIASILFNQPLSNGAIFGLMVRCTVSAHALHTLS